MNWAWEQPLVPSAKLILMALADDADDSGTCWPALRRIAAKCLVSERTVQRALKEFEGCGLLMTTPRFTRDGRQTSNGYQLALLPHPDRLSPSFKTVPQEGVTVVIPGVTGLRRRDGDTASSPLEPLLESLKEPPLQRPGVGGRSSLQFPSALAHSERLAIEHLLSEVPKHDAQTLLDELAGALETPGTIRTTAVRWFRTIVVRHARGQFSPTAGVHVKARRSLTPPTQGDSHPLRAVVTPSTEVRQRLEETKKRVLAKARLNQSAKAGRGS